jgi:hypothetical protein
MSGSGIVPKVANAGSVGFTGSMRVGLAGGVVGAALAVALLVAGVILQFKSVGAGLPSGTIEITDQLSKAFTYIIPTLFLIIIGTLVFNAFESSVNKPKILWWMGIISLIVSNAALVTSLFQVKVVSNQ